MSNHFWTYNLIIAMMVIFSTLIIVLGICFVGDLTHGAAIKVAHTFYGFPDNDPAGPATAYNCGRGFKAGGTGTYDDPLTFASAAGEFEQCEIIYDPYLSKYLINEDFCQTCDNQWKNGGIWHIDVWTGHHEINGGGQQIDCENRLTLAPDMEIIRRPAGNLPVDATALFNPAGFWCSLDHVNPNFVLTDAELNGTGPAIHPAHPSEVAGGAGPPSQQGQEGAEGRIGGAAEDKGKEAGEDKGKEAGEDTGKDKGGEEEKEEEEEEQEEGDGEEGEVGEEEAEEEEGEEGEEEEKEEGEEEVDEEDDDEEEEEEEEQE